MRVPAGMPVHGSPPRRDHRASTSRSSVVMISSRPFVATRSAGGRRTPRCPDCRDPRVERFTDEVIGHADPRADGGDVRGEAAERRAVRQQDREVVETEGAAARACHAWSGVELEEMGVVAVRAQPRRGRGRRMNAKAEHVLVVLNRTRQVTDLKTHNADVRSIGQAYGGRRRDAVVAHSRGLFRVGHGTSSPKATADPGDGCLFRSDSAGEECLRTVHEHLHRHHHQQHAHQALHGDQAALTQNTIEERRREEDDTHHGPRDRHRQQ